MEKIKVNTVEQNKILEYIYENFYPDCIKLKVINRSTIEVTDVNHECMIFEYKNGSILAMDNKEYYMIVKNDI